MYINRNGDKMKTRNTIQKSLVLQVVHLLKNHATADEIHDEVIKQHPSISKATVYRNLNQLAGEGKIRKIDIPNGADCFDHIVEKHYHAKCQKCGKILDVKMDYMSELESKIENSDEFDFNEHDIVFKGICKQCKNEMSL